MKLFSRELVLAAVASVLVCNVGSVGTAHADQTSATNSAVAAAGNGPYTMKYKFVVGKTNEFASSINMVNQMTVGAANQPMDMHMTMTMVQTVQSIDPTTGSATEKVTLSDVASTLNGDPVALSPQETTANSIITVSPNGQTTTAPNSTTSMQVPGISGPGGIGMLSFLPQTPVNVGDTWNSAVPIGEFGINLICKMTLKSVKVVDGDSIATIESKITSSPGVKSSDTSTTVTADSNSFGGTVITTFDIDKGIANAIAGNMVMDATAAASPGSSQGSMHMHMTMDMNMALLPSSSNITI